MTTPPLVRAMSTTMPTRPRMYTSEEVADWLKVEAKTISRWCQSGRLFAIKTPGGHWRIAHDTLAAMWPEVFHG